MENDAPPPFGSTPQSVPPPLSQSVPPPPPPPPIITPAAAPVKSRKGRGWMIVAAILCLLLAVSLLFNVGSFFQSLVHIQGGHQRYAGPRLDEVVVEDNDASDKIAVVPVQGIITSHSDDRGVYNMVDVIKAQLNRAEEDKKVKAVILKVDSPGGEVLASDDISTALAEFQKTSQKPVIVSMGSLAASGGYYVSAPARWIVANELTITGSIGVIMSGLNYRGLMNKIGLKPNVYKSGKHKDMLSGMREPDEVTEEERAMVQGLIDETYKKFKSVVADGRKSAHEENEDEGHALAGNWAEYADGRVFTGKQALELGFVDELGNFDTAVERAIKITGVKNGVNLIEYRQRYVFGDFLGLLGEGRANSRTLKVDIGVETPKIEAGKMYFLSPTYLH